MEGVVFRTTSVVAGVILGFRVYGLILGFLVSLIGFLVSLLVFLRTFPCRFWVSGVVAGVFLKFPMSF